MSKIKPRARYQRSRLTSGEVKTLIRHPMHGKVKDVDGKTIRALLLINSMQCSMVKVFTVNLEPSTSSNPLYLFL